MSRRQVVDTPDSMISFIARLIMLPFLLFWRALGWQPVGTIPENKKLVIIGAPHTSGWDYLVSLAAAGYFGIRPTILVKHTLMPGPFGVFVRLMGGVPVDRSAAHNIVDQVVEMFDQREEMILLLSPEGTRSKTDYWKTGFYHIALGAQVPILPAFVNYRNKHAGFGPLSTPTGDIEADMATIHDFYAANASGLHPEKVSAVRIRPNTQTG